MRECTAILYTLTGYEFFFLGSKHPTISFTGLKHIIFLFTQNSNPNQRVHMFKFFEILQVALTLDGKKVVLPDTISRNIPQELITRKTTVIIQQNIKLFLAEDETSLQLEGR